MLGTKFSSFIASTTLARVFSALACFAAGKAVRRHVEQKVRKTEIRQKVPGRHEAFEVASRGRLEPGVAVGEIERGGHRTYFESVISPPAAGS